MKTDLIILGIVMAILFAIAILTGCHKQCLESVTLPVPIRPEMPESLRTLPRSPCIERPCWVDPDKPRKKDDPPLTSCLTTETEPDYQKWIIERHGYMKACKVWFESGIE